MYVLTKEEDGKGRSIRCVVVAPCSNGLHGLAYILHGVARLKCAGTLLVGQVGPVRW